MKTISPRKSNLFGYFSFIIVLFFTVVSCEVDPIESEINTPEKQTVSHDFEFNQISFSDLSNDQNFKGAFNKVSAYSSKKSSESELLNFTIDTTSIKKINYGDNVTYTMLIKRKQHSKDYFENLILKVDSLNNVETYIVKYTLNSPLEYYSEHESFSIDAQPEIRRIYLENTADLIVARSTCISLYGTRCNGTLDSGCGGAWHTPGPNCQCVVIYQSGLDCSTEGGDPVGGGIIDDDYGGGGGISEGVVTAPNVDAYLWELKNFSSGELNREQRSYYNSNGNIKNNIDTYLISKNFSVFSILDSKLAINVGMALSLDYKVFNWAFKNSNTILEKASLYLADNGNSSQAIAFAKQGLIVAKQGGEVDFEEGIIVDIIKECQKEIIVEGIDNCSPLSSLVLGIFGGNYDIDYVVANGNLGINTSASTSNIVHYNSVKKMFR